MGKREKMILLVSTFLLTGLFLTGCPKKVVPPLPPPEKPPFVHPMDRLLQTFSLFETFQARASIRIDTVEGGEKNYYVLNGVVFYQRPDKLRILGFHPLGVPLFDSLYREGELFILVPFQKKAYRGVVSEFQEWVEKVGPIEMSSTNDENRNVPSRIRIVVVEKEIDIELKLKDPLVNQELPPDTFVWAPPEGIRVRPLETLLRRKRTD